MASVPLEPFDELIALLRENEFASAASAISALRQAGWTSSSEMLGELGLELLRFRAQAGPLPGKLERQLELCMAEVRKAWPHIRLPA